MHAEPIRYDSEIGYPRANAASLNIAEKKITFA
jgi:hypothetical protein